MAKRKAVGDRPAKPKPTTESDDRPKLRGIVNAALAPASDDRARLHALIDASEYFGSDLTQIILRDDNQRVLSVGVIARGDTAEDLERWLRRCDRKEANS